ncbi:helix-turn-helix domain-containing protein [Sinimarinibacterium flocculans]|uniref:helix-turn-helix domain-containing protein n=1 Tax=Sinimarinibacterium flocculans TaxID=985250 RepID=UPI0035153486
MQTASPTHSDEAPFGRMLRDCRRARRLSQLDLALNAEVSQRHLSFLESGRARPSREMVVQLAVALDLPLRERTRLLQSAGYAGLYPQRRLEAADMQPVQTALDLLLSHHEPYPAIVVDRAWNLVSANPAMGRVLSIAGDAEARWRAVCGDGPRNVLKLTFHPEGLRPLIANLEEIAPPFLARTAREALEHPDVQDVLDEVLRYPGLPSKLRHIDLEASRLPVLPMHYRIHGTDLRLFTMMTTFGTPQDVTADDLRVESFFPADDGSASLLRALAGT